MYAVGGLAWAGTMASLGSAFSADLPPVPKLILIGFADFPRTVADVAEWAQIERVEAAGITAALLQAGHIAEHVQPAPRKPSLSALREIVFERDDGRCRHCGVTERLSLDHIYPKSLGGSDELDNLQTLCRSCNSRKGAKVQ
jgi:hypothetical protein